MSNCFIANEGKYEIIKTEDGFEVWDVKKEELVTTWGFDDWNMDMEDHDFIKLVRNQCEKQKVIIYSMFSTENLMSSEKFIKIAIKQTGQDNIELKTIRQFELSKYLNVDYKWNMAGTTLENGIYVWWNEMSIDTLVFTGGIEKTGFNESLNFNQIEYLKNIASGMKIKEIMANLPIKNPITLQSNELQIA